MKEIEGDLVRLFDNGRFDVIVHGCNCFTRMKSGIAKQIVKRWPLVEIVDSSTEKGFRGKLGGCTICQVDRICGIKGEVVNAYTQYYYGNDGKKYVEYPALDCVFKILNEEYKGKGKKFGIPLIGCGLAGGDWNEVSRIIDYAAKDLDITLVRYKE